MTTLKHLFCPTDFTPPSEVALVHALRLAQLSGGRLTVFHPARSRAEVEASPDLFARASARLSGWGALPESAPSGNHPDAFGFVIKRVGVLGRDPTAATIEYLGKHPCDLLVLSRHRVGRLRRRSTGARLASSTRLRALVFPDTVNGFVGPETGHVSLTRVLIPVDPWPDARLEITLLRTAGETEPPRIDLPDDARCTWHRAKAPGERAPEILRVAEKTAADMIVMPGNGHRPLSGSLRPSDTARVLAKAPCAVMTIPATTTS